MTSFVWQATIFNAFPMKLVMLSCLVMFCVQNVSSPSWGKLSYYCNGCRARPTLNLCAHICFLSRRLLVKIPYNQAHLTASNIFSCAVAQQLFLCVFWVCDQKNLFKPNLTNQINSIIEYQRCKFCHFVKLIPIILSSSSVQYFVLLKM